MQAGHCHGCQLDVGDRTLQVLRCLGRLKLIRRTCSWRVVTAAIQKETFLHLRSDELRVYIACDPLKSSHTRAITSGAIPVSRRKHEVASTIPRGDRDRNRGDPAGAEHQPCPQRRRSCRKIVKQAGSGQRRQASDARVAGRSQAAHEPLR